MSDQLILALCPLDIAWEDPTANYEKIEKIAADVEADIFILPEMFATSFTLNRNMAEAPSGRSVNFMKRLAVKKDFVVCGSLPTVEEGRYFNRFYWVEPDGKTYQYDKRHLFSYDNEQAVYTAGDSKIIINYKGWKICPLICYDLRFPVWSRNTGDYDLYIYVANWPSSRGLAWETLLRARAIENMAFVAGVNRSGLAGNQLSYSGFSAVYDVLGNKMEGALANSSVNLIAINKLDLINQRNRYGFLNDGDSFEVIQ